MRSTEQQLLLQALCAYSTLTKEYLVGTSQSTKFQEISSFLSGYATQKEQLLAISVDVKLVQNGLSVFMPISCHIPFKIDELSADTFKLKVNHFVIAELSKSVSGTFLGSAVLQWDTLDVAAI